MNAAHSDQRRAGAVLTVIADALTQDPANAALAHFPSLRAQTRRLNADFVTALDGVDVLINVWRENLLDPATVPDHMREPGSDLMPFRQIAPILVTNFQRVARKLMVVAKPADRAETVEEIDRVCVRFDDFIDLGTAVRQYVDSLIETAYQIVALDPARFNYRFLESLMSFAPVAPVSMHQTLYSDELQEIVREFSAMSGRARRASEFSRNTHAKFGERVTYIVEQIGGIELQERINALFKFCSDFVHLGYASSVALGTTQAEQIVIGAGDLYTAPAENLAELRLRLLRECTMYYVNIFLPALVRGIESTLQASKEIADSLKVIAQGLSGSYGLQDRFFIEFIRNGRIGSDAIIHIECGRCGGVIDWRPPHWKWHCYCDDCGARFQADVVPDAVDYIVSCEGESVVNGGDAPALADLPKVLREKLRQIRERHVPVRHGAPLPYVQITDLENIDVETLRVSARCVSVPAPEVRGHFTLIAYVASKALARQKEVEIRCACGSPVIYETVRGDNFAYCASCQRGIGIWGFSGDGTHVELMNSPGGTPQSVPIHGVRSTQLPRNAPGS